MQIELDFVTWREPNKEVDEKQPVKISIFANGSLAPFVEFNLEDAVFNVMRSEREFFLKHNDANEKTWMHPEDYANAMSIALELRRMSDEYMRFLADNYTTKNRY